MLCKSTQEFFSIKQSIRICKLTRRNLDINAYSHTNCKCQKDVNMVLTLFELGCKEEKRRRGGERSEKCIVVLGLD